MLRPFTQVDVFTAVPYRGNPVAVVLDGTGLSTDEMQRFAHWTNLSETTFVLPPTEPGADYLVRIFTPTLELPFAGHPTLGTCHAWLAGGGRPASGDTIVQQCAVGLITIRRDGDRLAFAAPPRTRSGPLDDATVERVTAAFGIDPASVLTTEWVANGPPWMALLLDSPETVLAVNPGFIDADVGLVAVYPPGSPEAIEVRGFFPKEGATIEDPVTGSLNASVAQWLTESGRVAAPYIASQGTALGRAGRVHVSEDESGQIWIGGDTVTCIDGTAEV